MQPLEDLLKKTQALNKAEKYSEVIELLPDDVLETYQSADLFAEKAEAYFRLGKDAFFNKVLEKALIIDENHAKANNYKGYTYSEVGEFDKAIEAFNKAIQTNSKCAFPLYGLGNIYSILRKNDKAVELYQRAIETDPQYSLSYNALGNIYVKQKKIQLAIENYTKCIEIDSEYANPHYGLGSIYYDQKKYKKAISAYNKALEINPNFSAPYYNRALAYEKIEEFKKALEDIEKYIDLTRDSTDYYPLKAHSKYNELKKSIEYSDYSNISEMIEKIKKLLLFQEDCVTHYTSLSTAKALIFDKSKFWLSEGTFLNDTSEGRELFKFLPSINTNYQKPNDTISLPFTQKKPFIGSFVAAKIKSNDLTLWRMYGKENDDEAKGCAIELDSVKLLENLKESLIKDAKTEIIEKTDEEFCFYRVAYRKEAQEGQDESFIIPGASMEDQKILNDYMIVLANKVQQFWKKNKKVTDNQNLVKVLNGIAYLFKSAEYHYEHELRLVVDDSGFRNKIRIDPNLPRVYIELVSVVPFIRKITLGPKVERADEWAAAFYYSLDQQDYHPEILISHLPFK